MSKWLLKVFEAILIAMSMFTVVIVLPLFLFRMTRILLGAYWSAAISDFVFFVVGLGAGACIILTLLWLAKLNVKEKPDGPDRNRN